MNIMKTFKKTLSTAKNILILTGSGISAESGVPTFRGSGDLWRKHQAFSLSTPEAFAANPSLVWEFYEYRRELVSKACPNQAHEAIAMFQNRLSKEGRSVIIVTQNIDGLHQKAGTKNVIELHGSLYRTQCTKCKDINHNELIPICPSLERKISPNPNFISSHIAIEDLPRCKKNNCGALLRPDIIWFGESLDSRVLQNAEKAVDSCDACLIIGTSSTVYPAAMFAPQVAQRGISVAEFNLETTSASRKFEFHFKGPCTITVPQALAV